MAKAWCLMTWLQKRLRRWASRAKEAWCKTRRSFSLSLPRIEGEGREDGWRRIQESPRSTQNDEESSDEGEGASDSNEGEEGEGNSDSGESWKATEKVEMAKATKPMAKVLEKEKQPMVKQPTEKKAEMEKARTNPTTRPRPTIPPIPNQPTKVLVEKTLTPVQRIERGDWSGEPWCTSPRQTW